MGIHIIREIFEELEAAKKRQEQYRKEDTLREIEEKKRIEQAVAQEEQRIAAEEGDKKLFEKMNPMKKHKDKKKKEDRISKVIFEEQRKISMEYKDIYEERHRVELASKRKIRTRVGIICAFFVMVIAAAAGFGGQRIAQNRNALYQECIDHILQDDYRTAQTKLPELNHYEDSDQLVKYCETMLDIGRYEKKAEDYKTSLNKIKGITNAEVIKHYSNSCAQVEEIVKIQKDIDGIDNTRISLESKDAISEIDANLANVKEYFHVLVDADKLNQAKATLSEIENKTPAGLVIQEIYDITEISVENQDAIKKTREDYNALIPDDQTKVINIDLLDSAEKELKKLLDALPKGNLSITMLDVGQGLSILITSDGESMLYDGGGRESSSYVVSYLEKHGITNLKYIVASHYDEDHIAGLVGTLSKYHVDYAMIPHCESDTQIYGSFMEKLYNSQASIIYPEVAGRYQLGNSEFEILGPNSYEDGSDNDRSIALRLWLGDFSCIMTGDAEEPEEEEIVKSGINIDSDLYIVGHHGSSSSSSDSFLANVTPSAVFISVGEYNQYGHPTEETMERLKNTGACMFRTDLQGEVTVTTDGKHWEYSTDACDDWSEGVIPEVKTTPEKTADEENEEDFKDSHEEESTESFVLNVSTKKIHHPTCRSIGDMNPDNKKDVEDTLDNLLSQGYTTCGNCFR